MKTKICIKCNKKLPITEFYKQCKKLYGRRKTLREDYHPQCKQCRNQYYYKTKKEHPEQYKKYSRTSNLKRNSGITVEEYDSMFAKQNGVCAICGKKEKDKNQFGVKRLAVDHDHLTDKNRGLLCAKCNRGLGLFEDNIEYLLNTIEYLREYNAY